MFIGDEEITGLRPYKRPVNTVFQSYALFPHLTVRENVSFGLRRRGVKEYRARTDEMLALVELDSYGDRKPAQLSGGQQQRVALARALVNHPGVLLLDEPLGALDLKLRRQMQIELKRLQTELGITFVHVTHDQEEAMTMADTIAVMNNGLIEQMGAPAELYENPRTTFVANFLGQSNLFMTEVVERSERGAVVESHGQKLRVDAESCHTDESRGWLGVRPEKVAIVTNGSATDAGANVLSGGRISDVSFVGVSTQYLVAMPWQPGAHGLRAEHRPARSASQRRGGRPGLVAEALVPAGREPDALPREWSGPRTWSDLPRRRRAPRIRDPTGNHGQLDGPPRLGLVAPGARHAVARGVLPLPGRAAVLHFPVRP